MLDKNEFCYTANLCLSPVSEFAAFLSFNVALHRSNPSASIAISEIQNDCFKNLKKGTLSHRLVINRDVYKAQKTKNLALDVVGKGVV